MCGEYCRVVVEVFLGRLVSIHSVRASQPMEATGSWLFVCIKSAGMMGDGFKILLPFLMTLICHVKAASLPVAQSVRGIML